MRLVMAEERVGLVLAGGGARGAYEVGALSVLLPALEARGERPTVLVGTSVGAINIAYLAANADLSADDAVAGGVELWRSLRWDQVLGPLLAPSTAVRALCYAADVLGVGGAMLTGVLDTRPLARTVRRAIDFERLHRHIDAGLLDAIAVVATSAATTRSVVFVEGQPVPAADAGQGIDYVAARIDGEHVRASAAIPTLFPAVHVSSPVRARGWYVDGGVRLNAPLRPALSLEVDRVVVIGLNAVPSAPPRLASEHRPDAFQSAADFLNGTLVNQLVEDVRDLARVNLLLGDRGKVIAADGRRYRRVPFIFITPRARADVGGMAERIFEEHYEGLEALRSIDLDLALLARLIGGDGAGHGELSSYLFFAPEFATALIELGRSDAQRWLTAHTGPEGPWEVQGTVLAGD
jgi:NTE family protein